MLEPQSRFAVNLLNLAAVNHCAKRRASSQGNRAETRGSAGEFAAPCENSATSRAQDAGKERNRNFGLFRYRKPQVAQKRTDAAGPPRRRSLRSDDQVRRTFGPVRARRMGKRNRRRNARPAPRARHGARAVAEPQILSAAE